MSMSIKMPKEQTTVQCAWGVGEGYALATGGFLAERAHKMARRKNKKSYVPKPEWRARDLKANAAGKGAQTKLRERERAQ